METTVDTRCLKHALMHLRLGRAAFERGEYEAAMMDLISAHRLHALSKAHGTASWERVSCVLRNAQRKFWAVVRSMPMPVVRGNA